MSDSTNPVLLVTGAAGQLGRRVVELLLAARRGRVVATTRSPDRLADLAAAGAELRQADFDDPASLARAFAGVDRLLLVSTDALDPGGRRLAQHRAAIAAARAAGVKHVVYTSAPAPRPDPAVAMIDDHFWTEAALFESAFDWTVLRNNLYTDLLLASLPRSIATGTLYSATGGAGRAYVTREDCARAAAAALVGAQCRAIHEIGGPAAVTLDEIAAIAGELSGRKLVHVPVGPEDLRRGLAQAGLPPALADGLVDFDVTAARGMHAAVTPAVATLTGRAPMSVREFFAANKARLLAPAKPGAH